MLIIFLLLALHGVEIASIALCLYAIDKLDMELERQKLNRR